MGSLMEKTVIAAFGKGFYWNTGVNAGLADRKGKKAPEITGNA
jgi:hypothetical protein